MLTDLPRAGKQFQLLLDPMLCHMGWLFFQLNLLPFHLVRARRKNAFALFFSRVWQKLEKKSKLDRREGNGNGQDNKETSNHPPGLHELDTGVHESSSPLLTSSSPSSLSSTDDAMSFKATLEEVLRRWRSPTDGDHNSCHWKTQHPDVKSKFRVCAWPLC